MMAWWSSPSNRVVAWPYALLVALAAIYLAFGVGTGGVGAVAGIGGATAVCISLALRERSRLGAAIVLIVGVTPFAVIASWTAVVPLTALLILAIGLPTVRTR